MGPRVFPCTLAAPVLALPRSLRSEDQQQADLDLPSPLARSLGPPIGSSNTKAKEATCHSPVGCAQCQSPIPNEQRKW